MSRTKRIARTNILPGQLYPPTLVAIYEYIEKYFRTHNYYPSIAEMVDVKDPDGNHLFTPSTSVLRYYLRRMEEFGMIRRPHNIARAYILIPRKQWAARSTATPRIPSNYMTKEG